MSPLARGILIISLTVIVLSFLPVFVEADEGEGGAVSGVYGTIMGFLDDLGKVAKDVSAGIHKLGKGIKQVQEFLDATVEEDCIFECPAGGPFEPNPKHIATSNGCGSFGLEDYLTADMLPTSEFINCCDIHDLCYGQCGADKDDCDLKFKKCLYKTCSSKKESVSTLTYKGCQAGAKLLYTGTTSLGCRPYLNAQREACTCIPHAGNHRKDEF